ncbi:hypothetical protein SCATT_p16800 (plasmid) [Streptantibioticus cattleyicolor NRRL 8057 = DSM 46488]|uniref:Uncharacterized protein n=1 Tax=Streptantibioticus cattleyicolor (strain ATCC 35852 / DSM 46488 / JCM 4925 / NBRC 14057 / NRRL 8057) TaxID=1003195 RepID=G8XHN6_STREN|nr:hypothetical protein SCATT_p16800 [Streptantibioticus cattleyicolor NRRL 8057 = DSM 46488]
MTPAAPDAPVSPGAGLPLAPGDTRHRVPRYTAEKASRRSATGACRGLLLPGGHHALRRTRTGADLRKTQPRLRAEKPAFHHAELVLAAEDLEKRHGHPCLTLTTRQLGLRAAHRTHADVAGPGARSSQGVSAALGAGPGPAGG